MSETALPKIWVKEDDTFEISMWVYHDRKDKKRVRVSRDKISEEGAVQLKFTFRRPQYKDLVRIKRECTEYKPEHGIFWTDPDKMTQRRFRELLRNWNLDEYYGGEYIFHTVEGKVVDKSMQHLMGLDQVVIRELIERLRERFDG